MHTVHVIKTIDVPFERAWAALDDFGGIANFHPRVESSPITNGIASGQGATRACHFYNGDSITETITDYRPEHGYTVELVDMGPFPLKHAVANLDAEPVGANKTKVSFKMQFVPKFGPVGWVMAKLMMKPQFEKILGQVIDGLGQHVRTGHVVGEKGVLVADA